VTLPPWEYLFLAFNRQNFHDIFNLIWIAAVVLLVVLVVLNVVRTRQLRHHPPYLELYDWLLYSGIIFFGMILVASVFVFEFFLVLAILATGLATLVWIRFIRFPPDLAAYERQLAKQRYYDRRLYGKPESTIRPKASKRRRRR
jgi:hypothetical protein